MRQKTVERSEARSLRRQGLPYKRIAASLNISVGSAYYWTKDIEVSADQRHENLIGALGPANPAAMAARAAAWSEVNRGRRRAYQAEGRRRARLGEPLHMAGCMLYWAEGSKDRNSAKLSNSDAHVLRFYWKFLQGCFALRAHDVTLHLNVYTTNDLTIEQVERHWLEALDLPSSCCRKHLLNHLPTSSSGQKKNKLPYGVCTLRVKRSTWLVQHIYGAIQEYGGFEEPCWLD